MYDLHRKRMKSQGNTLGQIRKEQSDETEYRRYRSVLYGHRP